MENRQQNMDDPDEDEEFVNGVPLREMPPPWTEEEKMFFKDALMTLAEEGKLTKGSAKDIKANMERAVAEVAAYNGSFKKYKDTSGGKWKKRKYDALYYMTKRFADEYVGTVAG